MPSEQQTSSGVQWNQVTWYSKLGAILLFLGAVPTLCFYIGTQYQAVQGSNALPIAQAPVVIHQASGQASPNVQTSTQSAISIQQVFDALGFNFTALPGLTVSVTPRPSDYPGPAYDIQIDGPPNPKAVSAADEYHAMIQINHIIEGSMGPDDAAPTVSSSTVIIGGVSAEKQMESYTDGYSDITLTIRHGKDFYYMTFPTMHDCDKQYTDAIISSLHFQ